MGASESWEDFQRELDPDRDVQRARVVETVAATLRARGVALTGTETSEQLADILTAVENFEAAVSEAGADRMVNTPESSQPEDEAFVLPARHVGESPGEYVNRLRRAARKVRG
jgi:hypothetical protein